MKEGKQLHGKYNCMGTKAGKKMKKENGPHASTLGSGVADFPLSNFSLMSFHHFTLDMVFRILIVFIRIFKNISKC